MITAVDCILALGGGDAYASCSAGPTNGCQLLGNVQVVVARLGAGSEIASIEMEERRGGDLYNVELFLRLSVALPRRHIETRERGGGRSSWVDDVGLLRAYLEVCPFKAVQDGGVYEVRAGEAVGYVARKLTGELVRDFALTRSTSFPWPFVDRWRTIVCPRGMNALCQFAEAQGTASLREVQQLPEFAAILVNGDCLLAPARSNFPPPALQVDRAMATALQNTPRPGLRPSMCRKSHVSP